MVNSFTFGNVNSLDYGVYIGGEGTFNAPERRGEMIAVPGRNGALYIDDGAFKNAELTYPSFNYESDLISFRNALSGLRNALCSQIGYQRLTDTFHPDEYRMAVYKNGLEVDPIKYNTLGQFDIEFDCKPQRFLVSGETTQTFTQSGSITNPTLFDARPLLAVTGSGTLTIGTQTITIIARSSSSSVIYIDCETQESWEVVSDAKVSRNDYVQNAGESFPVLSAGTNTVILGSGITRVVITPRWWRI